MKYGMKTWQNMSEQLDMYRIQVFLGTFILSWYIFLVLTGNNGMDVIISLILQVQFWYICRISCHILSKARFPSRHPSNSVLALKTNGIWPPLMTSISVRNRERTIIGSVSYRNRYWVYRIESYRLLLYWPIYVHHCRFINCWQVTLHDDQRAFKRPVTRPPRAHAWVLFYGPWYGRGLEGREAEGDCNLIPASPWHKDGAVLVSATITPHSLHQQEVITTVSCQSL